MNQTVSSFGLLSAVCLLISGIAYLFSPTVSLYLLAVSAVVALWAIGARD